MQVFKATVVEILDLEVIRFKTDLFGDMSKFPKAYTFCHTTQRVKVGDLVYVMQPSILHDFFYTKPSDDLIDFENQGHHLELTEEGTLTYSLKDGTKATIEVNSSGDLTFNGKLTLKSASGKLEFKSSANSVKAATIEVDSIGAITLNGHLKVT